MNKESTNFKYIDLFAGIGGFRIAFDELGCKCVFTSEWDKYCQITYNKNFSGEVQGDITQINETEIPDHNILVGGFPCQPFSISGVSKKNALGRPHGFKDRTQGSLFFDIARIIKEKQPDALLLENVKNLVSHDGGKTFKIIFETLEQDLGYYVRYKVLDAVNYVPQHRERTYIVGFKNKPVNEFLFPIYNPPRKPKVKSILENNPDSKYTLTDHLWEYLQAYAIKHRARGNGYGFGLIDPEGHTRTLSARYYKDGSEILIPQEGENPRRLTPKECKILMGFPQKFDIPVSDTQAYKQFGNSVVVPLVRDIAKSIVGYLTGEDYFKGRRNYTFVAGNDYNNLLKKIK